MSKKEAALQVVFGILLVFFSLWFFCFETFKNISEDLFSACLVSNKTLRLISFFLSSAAIIAKLFFGIIIAIWVFFGFIVAAIKSYKQAEIAREETRIMLEKIRAEEVEMEKKNCMQPDGKSDNSMWHW